MPATSQLDRVAMVVLRYLRKPVFVLIIVYAIGITGMALIPGKDADGNVEYMSLFHAFYFFTYTATTTGFGEIPNAFTDEQRLWAVFCLYMGVVAWLYAIGSIISLIQNPHFTMALNEHQFARSVRRIKQPFLIICGFGDTGSLLSRGLSDNWLGTVVIDTDPERIKALALRDYRVKMPGLCADPTVPKHLVDAGVNNRYCQAVVILTKDDEINFRITVLAKFLNPEIPVFCRTTSPHYTEQLSCLDNVTVVNPFRIFSSLMSMAITSPLLHNLNSCLVHSKEVKLGEAKNYPTGKWIICGYGKMGQWLEKSFIEQGISPVIIDPELGDTEEGAHYIRGQANNETLVQAGIDSAAGVVVATDNDHANLSILLSIHSLKPNIFTIVRQNSHVNQIAFDAARVSMILQSSLTTARRILKFIISPQTQLFIDYLQLQDESLTAEVVKRLQQVVGGKKPHLWQIKLSKSQTASVIQYLEQNPALTMGELLRTPHNLEKHMHCVPFVIKRDNELIMLPDHSMILKENDEILLCGTEHSETLLSATINNPYTLNYLVTGEDEPHGYFFQWVKKWRA